MAAAPYSPAVGDVVLGTPYAQGVPLPDDFEIGLIYEFNIIDKLFLVQWRCTTTGYLPRPCPPHSSACHYLSSLDAALARRWPLLGRCNRKVQQSTR